MGWFEDFGKALVENPVTSPFFRPIAELGASVAGKILPPLPAVPALPAVPTPPSLFSKGVPLPKVNVSVFKPDVGGLPANLTLKLPGAGTPLVKQPPVPAGLGETKVTTVITESPFKPVSYNFANGKVWTQLGPASWRSSTGETSTSPPPEVLGGVAEITQIKDGSRVDTGVSLDMSKMTAKTLPAEVQSTDIVSLIRRGQTVTVPQVLGVSLQGVGEEGMTLPFPDVEPIDLINAKLDPAVYNTLSSRDKNYWLNEKQKANQNLIQARSSYSYALKKAGISVTATGQYPTPGMIPYGGEISFAVSGNPLENAAESARYENSLIQAGLWSEAVMAERGRPATPQRKDITGVWALGGQEPKTTEEYTRLFAGAAEELKGRVQAVQGQFPIVTPTLPGQVPTLPITTPPSPFTQPPPGTEDLVAIVQGGGQTLLKNVRNQSFVLQNPATGTSQTLPANAFSSVSTRKDIAQRMGVTVSDFTKALA